MRGKGFVVGLCGLPGSGKSTLARALADATGWLRLDRDAMRREIFSSGGYSDADKAKLAELLRAHTGNVVETGGCVILDGMTLSRASERAGFAGATRAAGGHWLTVWVDCDVMTARARVSAANDHPAMDRDSALVDQVATRFEIPDDALRVDAALPVSVQLERVLEEIRAAAGGER